MLVPVVVVVAVVAVVAVVVVGIVDVGIVRAVWWFVLPQGLFQ